VRDRCIPGVGRFLFYGVAAAVVLVSNGVVGDRLISSDGFALAFGLDSCFGGYRTLGAELGEGFASAVFPYLALSGDAFDVVGAVPDTDSSESSGTSNSGFGESLALGGGVDFFSSTVADAFGLAADRTEDPFDFILASSMVTYFGLMAARGLTAARGFRLLSDLTEDNFDGLRLPVFTRVADSLAIYLAAINYF
jgi:hypothetical protein